MKKETIIKQTLTDDGILMTFISSMVDANMWHVVLEFIKLNDYDTNYLSTNDIKDIYDIDITDKKYDIAND